MDTRKQIMAIKTIAVVVPSHRQELTDMFLSKWQPLFDKYNVEFILVNDEGDTPHIEHNGEKVELETNLVSNHCAGVRQLGFLYVSKHLPEIKYIITLDTDVEPIGDPIADHINALNMKVPVSWMSTSNIYMRGFPYGVREEAQVMMSHGVWEGNPDYDAPTQLLMPKHHNPSYPKGVIPKGIFAPICGMNLAFRREVLPYVYFAPVGQYKGAERFDDIWMGLEVIKDFARLNFGIVTGYARVLHTRASNVFSNLEKEAVGIRKNEEYWQGIEDEWYKEFKEKREKWFNLTKENVN